MKTLSTCSALLLFFAALHVSAADLPAWIQQSRSAAAPRLSIPAFSKINAAIQNQGTVRVIVRLAPPPTMTTGFAVEGALKGTESVSKQRAEIARIQNDLRAILSTARGTAAKRFTSIPFMAMEVDATEFSGLAASSAIDLIEEDIPVPPTLMQSVPLIGGSSGSFSGYSGSGQTVAILDTGVDKSHPFLTGKVVSEACYSTSKSTAFLIPVSWSVCPSGSNSTATGSGVNCSIEGCEHGTHVAGIVAGNTSGFSGVAKDAKLISIQVYSKFPASACDSGNPCVQSYTSDQILGLQRVYELRSSYKISSVNLSLGGGSYTSNCDSEDDYAAEKAAIDTLRSVGIATVIASGNGGSTNAISAPACISTAISVGATDKTDLVASYSNSASMLNLLAPGSMIQSSTPGSGFDYFSGTSMATPHVAAAWAVLKSANPTASVSEVLSALNATGKSVTDSRNTIVKPRIQLDAAVNAIKGSPVNGVCGSAHNQAFNATPSANLCFSTSSTPSAVSGSGPWNWNCSGLNGGNAASCLAYTTSQQVIPTPFPQNFDSVTPSELPNGWSSSGTGRWQTHNKTVQPSGTSAHSSNNLVYFNSADISSGASALLASAPFSLSARSGAKASFWMYHDTQYYSSPDRVDVYVNTAATLTGASLLGSIYRYNGNTGWYQYTFAIPATYTGAANYLLFNGISGCGNDIHLDDIQVNAFSPAYYQLGFDFAGSGYGSVNSAPAGINCSGSAGSACTPAYFIGGTSVTLSAAPDSSSSYHSTFSGWSNDGNACLGNGNCAVTMNGPANVTGTFNRDKLVKFSSQSSGTYATIIEAIDAATTGQIIQLRDNSTLTPFADALNITKTISMTGGFNSNFTNNSGYTTSRGKLTITNNGLLKVQRLIIK